MQPFRDFKIYDWLIFAVPFALLGYVIILKYNNIDILNRIAAEDGLFENLQALLFLGAAVIALTVSIKAFRRGDKIVGWSYLIWFAGALFWTLEEISWGQRLLEFEPDDFFQEYNNQGETTLHNMKYFFLIDNGFVIIGLWGTLAWAMVKQFRREKLTRWLEYFSPSPRWTSYFGLMGLIYLLYLTVRFMNVHWWTSNLSTRELETGELMLAVAVFGMMVEALHLKKQETNSKTQKTPSR